jgi:plastocyanin
MRNLRWSAAACVMAALLLTSGVAEAATKTVIMGTPPSAQRDLQRMKSDVNAFFPSTSTIRQGDSLRFVPAGFHNADFPPRGQRPLPFAVPSGQPANATDAAGAPFWFNGQPQLGFNPVLLQSGFGKRFTYDGSRRLNSGLPLAQRPKPMSVRFTKTGRFTFYCDIHPGMKGSVRVVGRRARVPSARADRRRVARQVDRAMDTARDLPDVEQPANTFDVGVGGRSGEELLDFAPKRLQVARGTTVTFRISPRSREVHTATAGPGDPERQPGSYLGQVAATFQGAQFDPRATYGSEAPGTVASMSPALHGNGFWSSGVMDPVGSTPLPRSTQLRFDAPGSYTFFCLIHPFMKGTVDVQ